MLEKNQAPPPLPHPIRHALSAMRYPLSAIRHPPSDHPTCSSNGARKGQRCRLVARTIHGLNEPVVPPFPISDYGTGCMGAIAALSGLYQRATLGGSWHGKVSLLQYDLLLVKVGQYEESVRTQLHAGLSKDFLAFRHSHSVDDISRTTLLMKQKSFPKVFDREEFSETWYSKAYGADVSVVKPVVQREGVNTGFQRASRPNGSDRPSWAFEGNGDFQKL